MSFLSASLMQSASPVFDRVCQEESNTLQEKSRFSATSAITAYSSEASVQVDESSQSADEFQRCCSSSPAGRNSFHISEPVGVSELVCANNISQAGNWFWYGFFPSRSVLRFHIWRGQENLWFQVVYQIVNHWCFPCPVGTADNSPVVYCWDKRHIHIRISPVGTTEKVLHGFANSIIPVQLSSASQCNQIKNWYKRPPLIRFLFDWVYLPSYFPEGKFSHEYILRLLVGLIILPLAFIFWRGFQQKPCQFGCPGYEQSPGAWYCWVFWYKVQLVKGAIIRLSGVAECNHRKVVRRRLWWGRNSLKITWYPFWLETRLIPYTHHPHPSLPPSRAVRGRFLNVFELEAHDNWIQQHKKQPPLSPFLKGEFQW